MPAAHAEPNSRATSGLVRDSSFTTSAPWNASARPQLGAAMAIDSSTTDTSSKTPIGSPIPASLTISAATPARQARSAPSVA